MTVRQKRKGGVQPSDSSALGAAPGSHAHEDHEAHLSGLTPMQLKVVKLVVWQGVKFEQAMEAAGYSKASAWRMVRSPRLQRAISAEMKVLHQSVRPRLVHQLTAIIDGSDNDVAKVNAVKALADLTKPEQTQSGVQVTQAGYVIVLDAREGGGQVIEHVQRQASRSEAMSQIARERWDKRPLAPPDEDEATSRLERWQAQRQAANASRLERINRAKAGPAVDLADE